jgi:uncharacterized membrane-anchored protein
MNAIENMNHYRIFLRALEAIPILIIMGVCLAVSWYLRRTFLF